MLKDMTSKFALKEETNERLDKVELGLKEHTESISDHDERLKSLEEKIKGLDSIEEKLKELGHKIRSKVDSDEFEKRLDCLLEVIE